MPHVGDRRRHRWRGSEAALGLAFGQREIQLTGALGQRFDQLGPAAAEAGRKEGVTGAQRPSPILRFERERVVREQGLDRHRVRLEPLEGEVEIGIESVPLLRIPHRIVPVAHPQGLGSGMAQVQHHVGAPVVRSEAEPAFEAETLGIAPGGDVRAAVKLDAAIVSPQHDVHHAAQRAEPVNAAGRAGEGLDSIDGVQRDRVDVGLTEPEARPAHDQRTLDPAGDARQPAPVDQQQGGVGTQPAQVDLGKRLAFVEQRGGQRLRVGRDPALEEMIEGLAVRLDDFPPAGHAIGLNIVLAPPDIGIVGPPPDHQYLGDRGFRKRRQRSSLWSERRPGRGPLDDISSGGGAPYRQPRARQQAPQGGLDGEASTDRSRGDPAHRLLPEQQFGSRLAGDIVQGRR